MLGLETLRCYPPDVERYVLRAGWLQVSYRLPMHGRAAERGDELGSRLIAAASAADLTRVAFVLHRRWPPYAKWLGTALASLPSGGELASALTAAMTADDWRDREDALARAADLLLDAQGESGLPAPRPALNQFWDRPYRHANPAIVRALAAGISDPVVARLPAEVGSIEQWVDNVELLARPHRRAITASYRAWLTS